MSYKKEGLKKYFKYCSVHNVYILAWSYHCSHSDIHSYNMFKFTFHLGHLADAFMLVMLCGVENCIALWV